MYPSEKAIVLSPDRNKNTPIELNNAHHGNTSTYSFFHFCGEVKYFDASAGINGRNENFRDRSSFWSFLSRIHICLYGQKFVNELLKYSRLNLWRQNLAINGCVLKIRNASAPEKKYIHIYTLHWPLTESGTQMAIAVSFLNSLVEYDKTKH